MEMLLTGKPISAVQALTWGLVNRVVSAELLDDAVREFTDAVCATSPVAVRLGKAAFYDQLALDAPEAYRRAADVMTGNARKRDAQEGMQAFLDKRRPRWTGE
jgi:enoyl-CoA hydratase/carnithine racemase